MARRAACPHCRTELPEGDRPRDCPACGRRISTDDGHALRPIDVDFEQRVADLDRRTVRRIWQGAGGSLVVAIVGSALPGITQAILYFAQLIWIRLAIVAPYRRLYSPGRRMLTRWLSRLVLASLSGLHFGGMVPFLGLLVHPLLFAGLSALAWSYHRYHLVKEKQRAPLSLIEKALVFVALILLVAIVIVTVLLIWGLAGLLEMFNIGK